MIAMNTTPRPERKGSLLRTVKAVAWSVVGLRSRSGFDEDTQKLSPVHIIIVGLIGAALFVGVLILLVNWVVTP